MASVTGITAEKAQEIEDASVVSGDIDDSSGHLILTQADGTVIDAGLARDDAAIATAVSSHATTETSARNTAISTAVAAEATARNTAISTAVATETAARVAADTALTKATPLNLAEGTNFSPSNTTVSATSGGAPQLEGTYVIPPSGKIKVTVQSCLRASSGGGAGAGVYVGFQHRRTNVSGTIIFDYDPSRAALNENVGAVVSSMSVILADTPGALAYFRTLHIVDTGVTGGVRWRRLIVEGVD